jgi:hypothetical protein
MITCHDLLALARELSTGNGEAHWRASVSRSFYALFHHAKDWHADLPVPGSVGAARGTHEQLIQQLRSPARECTGMQQKHSRWLAGQLDVLRAQRVEADYELAGKVLNKEWAVSACANSARGIAGPT